MEKGRLRLGGADGLREFEERGGENLGLGEQETMTAPAVEVVAGTCFSKCALHFTQILLYKEATNNKNTINRSHLSIKENTHVSFRTPGFASVHEQDPDAAFVPGAAKGNPVGLRAEMSEPY